MHLQISCVYCLYEVLYYKYSYREDDTCGFDLFPDLRAIL